MKLIGNLNRKMKILKIQKENSKTEKYNKTYTKCTVHSRVGRAEESLNLNIG